MGMIDIMAKKLHHADLSRLIAIDGENALKNGTKVSFEEANNIVLENHIHIYLKNMGDDIAYLADLILYLFKHKKGVTKGVTIYTEESNELLGEYIKQKFNQDELEGEMKDFNISIQRIVDVGYIISIVKSGKYAMANTYTYDEYMSLMDEFVVVATAKQEKHYVKDWVAYHLRIGFDKIYLFDNNDKDGERYDELLKEYTDSGKLKIIDVRGQRGLQNSIYNTMYFAIPYKWMAIFDIDEFIWFNECGKYNDIKTFINDIEPKMRQEFFGIMLQWHSYDASGDDKPSDKPIWEANTKLLPFSARKDCRCEYIHDWCKSIYRFGYSIEVNEHFGWCNTWNKEENKVTSGCSEVNCYGEPTLKTGLSEVSEEDFLKQEVYVKHFLLRNIDDFFKNKYLRGHAGGDFGIGEDGWRFYQWFQNLNYFTDSKEFLTEKEQKYLNKKGMKMNYTFHPDVFVTFYILESSKKVYRSLEQNVLADNLYPNASVYLNKISIRANNLVNQDDEELPSSWDSDFMARSWNGYYYHDMYIGDTNHVRKGLQDPIFVNMGIPAKYTVEIVPKQEQELYIDTMKRIFGKDDFRRYLRLALYDNITTIPMINIERNNPDNILYKDEIVKILNDMGCPLTCYKLLANTFVMSYNQYMKMVEFQHRFIDKFGYIGNNDIIKCIKEGKPNIYDSYISTVLSVVSAPYFIWPA